MRSALSSAGCPHVLLAIVPVFLDNLGLSNILIKDKRIPETPLGSLTDLSFREVTVGEYLNWSPACLVLDLHLLYIPGHRLYSVGQTVQRNPL